MRCWYRASNSPRISKAATATVHVLDDKHTQRILSVSPDNLPREYELTYTVRFSVTAGDKELLAAQEVVDDARVQLHGQ